MRFHGLLYKLLTLIARGCILAMLALKFDKEDRHYTYAMQRVSTAIISSFGYGSVLYERGDK